MNHKVKTHSDSFDIIFDKLKTGKPFSYVRFGDGDYIMMYEESLNQIIGGGNRFFVTPRLQKELIECHGSQLNVCRDMVTLSEHMGAYHAMNAKMITGSEAFFTYHYLLEL